MATEPVSVLDLAAQAGKRKQFIFKVLARLNIQTTKQRSSRGRGQLVAYVTAEDAKRVLAELESRVARVNTADENRRVELAVSDAELGVFYLIALDAYSAQDDRRFRSKVTGDSGRT